MRLAAAVLVCAGCNAVFGLHPVGVPVDAIDAPVDVDCATLVDFDHDCVADNVDNCPVNANSDQRDTDMPPDGVGDVCDPHPASSGDRILFFDTFQDSSAWTPNSGAHWQLMPGLAMHTDPTDTVGVIQHQPALTGENSVTLEASFTLHSFAEDGSSNPRLGVLIDSSPNNYDGHTCFVTPFGAPNADTAYLEAATTDTTSISIPTQGAGSQLVFRMTADPDALYCHLVHDGGMNDSIQTITRTLPWPSGGFLGVQVRQATADAHYVIAYASP